MDSQRCRTPAGIWSRVSASAATADVSPRTLICVRPRSICAAGRMSTGLNECAKWVPPFFRTKMPRPEYRPAKSIRPSRSRSTATRTTVRSAIRRRTGALPPDSVSRMTGVGAWTIVAVSGRPSALKSDTMVPADAVFAARHSRPIPISAATNRDILIVEPSRIVRHPDSGPALQLVKEDMWIRSHGAAARWLRLAIFAGGVSLVGLLLHQLGVNTIAGLVRRASPTLAVILLVRGIYICLRAIALVGCLPIGTLRLREAIRVRLAGETLEVLTLTGPFLS